MKDSVFPDFPVVYWATGCPKLHILGHPQNWTSCKNNWMEAYFKCRLYLLQNLAS